MRRGIIMGLVLCLFCGCSAGSAPYYETVHDVLPTCEPEDAACRIRAEVPEDAVPTVQTDTLCVWKAPNGDYEITARILVTDGFDAAVYALCGFAQTRIDLDGGRECRVAWCADGAVFRALLRMDGDFCYLLMLRLKEGRSGEYRAMINALFSSFALVPKET